MFDAGRAQMVDNFMADLFRRYYIPSELELLSVLFPGPYVLLLIIGVFLHVGDSCESWLEG